MSSVASLDAGAALYSVIQQTKVTQIITQMQEYAKGIEQYMLDNGQDISAVAENVNIVNLVENKDSVKGWNGPYIDAVKSASDFQLDGIPVGSNKWLYVKQAKASVAWDSPGAAHACDGSNDCYIWIETNCYSESIAKALDLQIDGVAGATANKLRYKSCSADPSTYRVFYQTVRTIKQ